MPAGCVKRPLVRLHLNMCVCLLVQDEERQCQGTNQSDKAIQVAGKGTEAGRREQAWGQIPHLPFQAAVPPTATIHWS